MKLIMILMVGFFVIVSQTSDRTASINNGDGTSTVVSWS